HLRADLPRLPSTTLFRSHARTPRRWGALRDGPPSPRGRALDDGEVEVRVRVGLVRQGVVPPLVVVGREAAALHEHVLRLPRRLGDRKSTRLNSSHGSISY